MSSYSVSDLVGKTIVAKSDISVYRLPADNAPAVFTIKPGQSVGVVDTYFLPKEGRAYLYLGFLDTNKRPYYIRWGNAINTSSLLSQGVKSDEVKAAEAEAANKPFNLAEFIQKNLTMIVFVVAGVAVVRSGLETYSRTRK